MSKLGIKTTLIAGPSKLIPYKDLKIKNITTADQMIKAVKNSLPVDIAVCAAAVSDFKPKFFSKNKIKGKAKKFNVIEIEKNPDILSYLGKNNRYRPKIVVGFSAETNDLIKNSTDKLKKKYCDLIVANDVSKKDSGFNVDYNKVSIIDKSGIIKSIPKNKKSIIADIVAKIILKRFLINDKDIN